MRHSGKVVWNTELAYDGEVTMPEFIVKFTVPDGTTVTVAGIEGAEVIEQAPAEEVDPVRRYFNEYLSDNGRKVFAAAARTEDIHGPGFTLEDIAANLSVSNETVRSWHRTAGRSAKRWRRETGTREPIRLESLDYDWDARHQGFRTTYRLPERVAEEIINNWSSDGVGT